MDRRSGSLGPARGGEVVARMNSSTMPGRVPAGDDMDFALPACFGWRIALDAFSVDCAGVSFRWRGSSERSS
jgi:hypothetical protein